MNSDAAIDSNRGVAPQRSHRPAHLRAEVAGTLCGAQIEKFQPQKSLARKIAVMIR